MAHFSLLNFDVELGALFVVWKNANVRDLVAGPQRTNMRVACPGDGYSQVVEREDHRDLAGTLGLVQHSHVPAIRMADEYDRLGGARVSEPFQRSNRISQAVHAGVQLSGA